MTLSPAVELTVPPKTTATLTVTATEAADPLIGATLTGTFRDPDLKVVASAIPFTDGGDGTYTMLFDPSWTDRGGQPRLGTFYLDVLCVKDASQLLERWTVHVVL